MTIAFKTITSTPDKKFVFDFGPDATVLSYVVGISYWKYSFQNTDQRVTTIAMSLGSNSTGSQVTTNVTATLQGGSHEIYNGNSPVTLTCVAILNTANRDITLSSDRGIASGGRSGPIPLCSTTPSISSACLSGFNLHYSNHHHVKTIKLDAGFVPDGMTGYITADASMDDNSNNHAENPTLDGGLIYVDTSQSSILAKALVDQQTASPVTVDFGRKLASAAVLLQSLTVSYGEGHDHDIKHVSGGVPGWKVDGQQVVLDSAQALMSDDSHNSQSNTDSRVSLIVLGIPA